jgi:hypothetical protein
MQVLYPLLPEGLASDSSNSYEIEIASLFTVRVLIFFLDDEIILRLFEFAIENKFKRAV